MSERPFELGILILGAGRSTRMGRPKLLLAWGNTSVVGQIARQWGEAGAAQVAAVHAANDQAMTAELGRVGISAADQIVNPNPERGMFSSVICAARWANWRPSITHFGIVLGDQPHLRQKTLADLVAFVRKHQDQVCQPSQKGRRRHPVILPKHIFLELAQSKVGSLKEFLQAQSAATFECDDPGLELDIDRPEDYEKSKVLAGL